MEAMVSFFHLWQINPQFGQNDRFGRSPLSWATEKGHNGIISFIISQRAPLDITQKRIWDAELIPAAIRKLHPSIFKLLPPRQDRSQYIGKNAATLRRPACNQLGVAVAQGYTQAVKTLLDTGAAKDIKDDTGFTPLMLTAEKGDFRRIALSKADASLDWKRQRGWGAAKIASPSGHHLICLLLNLGKRSHEIHGICGSAA
jgi:ankyrin repeat protein